MGELKIRVWNGEQIISLSKAIYNGLVGVQENRDDGFRLELFFDSVKIMRYIGLEDKNGIEIYEGDIVLIDIGDSFLEIKQQCVVKYDDMNASFCFETNNGNKIYLTRLGNPDFFIKNKVEVIGNIYENPELLVPLNDEC